MSSCRISIDRIKIRLQGGSSDQARLLAHGLGHEILSRLEGVEKLPARRAQVDRVDGGSIQASQDTGMSDLRQSVVNRISTAVTSAARHAK